MASAPLPFGSIHHRCPGVAPRGWLSLTAPGEDESWLQSACTVSAATRRDWIKWMVHLSRIAPGALISFSGTTRSGRGKCGLNDQTCTFKKQSWTNKDKAPVIKRSSLGENCVKNFKEGWMKNSMPNEGVWSAVAFSKNNSRAHHLTLMITMWIEAQS